MAEKRRAFKIFIIDGAKKAGTPKKLPKEQLAAEAQKRWKSCRYWPSFWDPQERSIILRSHTGEGKKNSESYNQNHMIDLKEPVKEKFRAEWKLKLKLKSHQGICVVKPSQGAARMVIEFA